MPSIIIGYTSFYFFLFFYFFFIILDYWNYILMTSRMPGGRFLFCFSEILFLIYLISKLGSFLGSLSAATILVICSVMSLKHPVYANRSHLNLNSKCVYLITYFHCNVY